MEILELSYHGLEEDFKEIFLDVACTLKYFHKENAIRALEIRGFHAIIGLRVLEQKSLITYDENGILGMHDQVEEMGRNIVRRLHPDEPYKQSRLWIKEETEDILTNDLGTQATKCLYFVSIELISEIAMKGLANMKDLKVLDILILSECDGKSNSINWKFDKVSEYLPSSLRFITWVGFPFLSLPNTFQGKHLVHLLIARSNIVRLWEYGEGKVLHKLRFLEFLDCKIQTFDLRVAPNLERFDIGNCYDFVEFHMPAHFLKLVHLRLSQSKLTTLHLGDIPNVEELILEDCNHLVELQMAAKCIKLKHVKLSHSKLKTLHIGSNPNLEYLILEGCNDLVELQMPVESLKLKCLSLEQSKLKTLHLGSTPNLEALILEHCNDLAELQMPAECPKLQAVHLSHSNLKTLHLGSSPNLEVLALECCEVLVELQMPGQSPKLKEIKLSHLKLKTLHLRSTPNLKKLILEGCDDLVELQIPLESIKLKYINLSLSKLKTLHLGSTANLKKLILKGCNALVELQMPVECLKLKYFILTLSKLKTLHLGSSPNLEVIILVGCNDLVELQMPIECLKLKRFILKLSKLKTLHLGSTPNLEDLILKSCFNLVELQMPVESLKLVELYLSHSKLKILDLGLTPNLKRLDLENCYGLVDINAPVGCLRNLAFLDLSGCGSFNSFLFNKELDSHVVGSLSELRLVAEPTDDVCPLHSDNDSPKFQFSCYYQEDPASSFGNLERLISLSLCPCTNLESFSRSICSLQCLRKLTLEGSIVEAPRDLDQLEYLEELTFSSTEIKYLPDSICNLKHLKSFEIRSCWLLEKLPEDIGRLESLEKLILTDCKLLQDIPNSFCKMKCINSFDLLGCIQVVELPEDIGCLEGLKELNIEDTGITCLPQSIFKLRGLRIIGSRQFVDTYGLLIKRRRTVYEDESVFFYI